MKHSMLPLITFFVLAVSTPLEAQDPPQFPEPVEEHRWLKQFVGRWESEAEAMMGPGQPAIECKGTMTTRMLGGFWVVSEVTSEMGGMKMTALQTIGYDPEKKKYVGTWVDSVMNHLWQYEGSVDESGKVLTLETEGPNIMADGKTAKFRDAYEFKSEDHIVATSSMLTDKGEWVIFITGHARRVK